MLDFFQLLPKVELHAHLNGSISPVTMGRLLNLHRNKWPEEELPRDCDTLIEAGKTGNIDDPFRMFSIIHSITDNPEAVRLAAKEVIQDFYDDGVKYLELRTTPRLVEGRMTKVSYCEAVLEEILSAREKGLKITVKLLLAVDRRNLDSLLGNIELFKQLKKVKRYSDLIVGMDISGDPRVGDIRTILDKLQEIRNDGVKLAVHLAEIPNIAETAAFLSFKPDRIGHGTCIHPSLGGNEQIWEQLMKSGCPVEVCLTSNVICQTVSEYKHHQAGLYHRNDVPIVLCTDDKGVFSCTLSGEYRIAAETFEWSNEQMYIMSLKAIDLCFAEEIEKNELKNEWEIWKNSNRNLFQVSGI